ncbi:dephospho-CoA kinase [Wansuia hejianensis]|uniref:Dephospho-CoA kinase n=1 Tax=Wansuia hejianensis TaxID=2763667 RepID=A0A926F2Q0_9FIRM|nr:dephospho-CoA kinase [Wansuia hejianensis]MBC8590839.1 dephospho-CoA kinase [Wansuia hejianensis]
MKHTNCKIIGLTGGIASGKSTVSSILGSKGYYIIDSDEVAKDIVKPYEPAYHSIIKFFGTSILNEDKTINRKKLGELVFSDVNLLQKLNQITHPYVFHEIRSRIAKNCSRQNIIFVDIPLLFEVYNELERHKIIFDEVWLVYVDEKTQLERLMKRNNLNLQEAKLRIEAQFPIEEKKKRATRIIDNMGDIESLIKNLNKTLDYLL